ncbi:unnamed protein product [Boreogadus saida]
MLGAKERRPGEQQSEARLISGNCTVAVVGVQAPLWRGSHPLWRGLTRPLKGVSASLWRGSQPLRGGRIEELSVTSRRQPQRFRGPSAADFDKWRLLDFLQPEPTLAVTFILLEGES